MNLAWHPMSDEPPGYQETKAYPVVAGTVSLSKHSFLIVTPTLGDALSSNSRTVKNLQEQGALAADMFAGFVLQIDLVSKRIELTDSSTATVLAPAERCFKRGWATLVQRF